MSRRMPVLAQSGGCVGSPCLSQTSNQDGGSLAFVGPLVGTGTATGIGAIVAAGIAGAIGVLLPDSTASDDTCESGGCGQFIVRGGTNFAVQFTNGSGVVTDADGKVWNVSVQSFPDTSIQDLSQRQWIPQNQIGVTTFPQLPNGAILVPDPTFTNPYHALLGGITAQQAQAIFQPTMPNPNPRIGY